METAQKEPTALDIARILSDPAFFANLRARAVDTDHPEDREQNAAAAMIIGRARAAKGAGKARRPIAKAKFTLALHDYLVRYFPNL